MNHIQNLSYLFFSFFIFVTQLMTAIKLDEMNGNWWSETRLTSLVFHRWRCVGKCSARGRLSKLGGKLTPFPASWFTRKAAAIETQTKQLASHHSFDYRRYRLHCYRRVSGQATTSQRFIKRTVPSTLNTQSQSLNTAIIYSGKIHQQSTR